MCESGLLKVIYQNSEHDSFITNLKVILKVLFSRCDNQPSVP